MSKKVKKKRSPSPAKRPKKRGVSRVSSQQRESGERFRSMFNATITGIAVSTPQGRFVRANESYCRMLGYTEDELRARDFASLTHPDDLPLNLKMRDELLTGERESFVMEKRYIRKNGDILWTRHSVSSVRNAKGQITSLIVVAEDITDRKRAEEKLQQRQKELQAFFDLMPALIWYKDTQNRIIRLNQRAASAAGKRPEELEGQSMNDLYPLEAAKYYADDLEVIRTRSPKLGIVETLRGSDGVERWVQTDKVPVFGEAGKVIGIIVMVQDITERRQAEEHLLWKTAFFEALVHSAQDAILVVNAEGQKILQNQRMIDLWNIPVEFADEADHRRRFAWITSQVKNTQAFSEKVAHLYAHPDEISLDELELVNGKFLERYSAPVYGADKKHYGRIWVYREITERKKLEEQLRHSQKMESIGTLAGGIAHDFNNILAVIQMSTDFYKSRGSLSPAEAEFVDGVSESVSRASALTRQLLTLGRKKKMEATYFDLVTPIKDLTQMLKRTLGEDIQIEFKFSPDPLYIHADAGMLDQVLMNLAVNARDAMPKGGKLPRSSSMKR
jgi:PAS domain S-box-containing protein